VSVRTCEDSDLTSRLKWEKRVCLKPLSLYRGKTYHVMRNSHDRQPSLSGAVENAKLRLVLVNFLHREKRCWNVVLEDGVKCLATCQVITFVCSDFWISERVFV